jgi:amino acid permease
VGMCECLTLLALRLKLIIIDMPSVASTIGKAAIVVLVMFSYPLQVHPCRASVDAVLKWRPSKLSRDSRSGSPSRAAPLLSASTSGSMVRTDTIGETKFAAITTAIIILSYVVAMTVSSLDKVLAYVGSTGSTSISFILPGLFYYKISAPESIHHQRLTKEDDDEYEQDGQNTEGLFGEGSSKTTAWRAALLRRLALALAIYGFLVMIVCLVTNLFFSTAH